MKKIIFFVVMAIVVVTATVLIIYFTSLAKKPVSSVYTLAPISDMVISVGSAEKIPVATLVHSKDKNLIRAQQKKLKNIVYATSSSDIATVTPDGMVEAVSDGTAVISVTIDDISAFFLVECYYALESIRATTEDPYLEPGQSEQLVVSYFPENASRYGQTTFVSESPEIVSVDENGMLTAHELGNAIIEVDCDYCIYRAEITVYQPIDGIRFTTSQESFNQGDTFRFSAGYIPATVSDPEPIRFSVSENVGTMTEDGLFTASGVGDGVVTAVCDDFVIETPVHVTIPLTGLSVSSTSVKLAPPATQKFPLILVPENATDYPEITYKSSNPSVASVGADGTVKALASGTCTISAYCGSYSVSVNYQCTTPLQKVSISTGNLCLGVGSQTAISAVFTPANASHGEVSWIVEKPAIVSVSNGMITGLSVGNTAVAVSCDGLSAVISVRVQTAHSAAGQATADKIINFAKQYIGTPYFYGGTDLKNGIDCSSFTQQCFAQAGIQIPRVSYAQANTGTTVCLSDQSAWLPGDLIFFQSNGRVSHVAIYLGGGQMIHANESLTKSVAISATSYTSSKGLITPCLVKRLINN